MHFHSKAMQDTDTIKEQIHPYFASIQLTDDSGHNSKQTGLVIARSTDPLHEDNNPYIDDLLVLTYVTADKKSAKMSICFDHREQASHHPCYPKYNKNDQTSMAIALSLNEDPIEYIGMSPCNPINTTKASPKNDDYVIFRVHEENLYIEKITFFSHTNREIEFICTFIQTRDLKGVASGLSKFINESDSIKPFLISACLYTKEGIFIGFVKKVHDHREINTIRASYILVQDLQGIISESSKNKN